MKLFIIFILMIAAHRNAHCSMQLFSSDLSFRHNAVIDDQDPPDDMAVDKMPTPVQTQYPSYPFTARQEGLTGTVYLKLLVGEDGLVQGLVDGPRRHDHRQQHTGQHVLSAAFESVCQARTESFHLGVASSTIDLNRVLSPADTGQAGLADLGTRRSSNQGGAPRR